MSDPDRDSIDIETAGDAKDVVVTMCESLEEIYPQKLSQLEARTKSPLYYYLYGPYRQHQFLVDTVLEVKCQNGVYAEMNHRIFPVSPCQLRFTGQIVAQSMWVLNILLPFIFITVGCLCYSDWIVCGCSVALCILISIHSFTVFIVLHNNKAANRLWFVHKVDLKNYFDRENSIFEATLENVNTVQFLSAGQRSQIISRLAKNPGKKAVLMVCARSFWISRVLHPLLCLVLLIILCLAALIIDVDMIRRHHNF